MSVGVAITDELVARVLIAACRRKQIDPAAVFDKTRLGAGAGRLLAGIVLAPRIGRDRAAKVCGLSFSQQLAPSQWYKSRVTQADVDALELELAPLFAQLPRQSNVRETSSAIGAAAAVVSIESAPPRREGHAPGDYLQPRPEVEPLVAPSSTSGSRTASAKLTPISSRALSEKDARLYAGEFEFVQARRAAGVSWANIARQLIVNELDLRRRHDPEFHL